MRLVLIRLTPPAPTCWGRRSPWHRAFASRRVTSTPRGGPPSVVPGRLGPYSTRLERLFQASAGGPARLHPLRPAHEHPRLRERSALHQPDSRTPRLALARAGPASARWRDSRDRSRRRAGRGLGGASQLGLSRHSRGCHSPLQSRGDGSASKRRRLARSGSSAARHRVGTSAARPAIASTPTQFGRRSPSSRIRHTGRASKRLRIFGEHLQAALSIFSARELRGQALEGGHFSLKRAKGATWHCGPLQGILAIAWSSCCSVASAIGRRRRWSPPCAAGMSKKLTLCVLRRNYSVNNVLPLNYGALSKSSCRISWRMACKRSV